MRLASCRTSRRSFFRLDASAQRTLGRLRGEPVTARASVGYTFLARSHLNDEILGQDTHALNASLAVRWTDFEVGVDGYNILGLQYADDAQVYASTWGHPASVATHLSAAPPATVIGTIALHL